MQDANARIDELEESIKTLEAKLLEACVGGTKETPLGFEQRLNKIEDDLEELEDDGKLRNMLALWEPTAERQTPVRLALLEAKSATNARVLWSLGSSVVLAIVGAVMGLILN